MLRRIPWLVLAPLVLCACGIQSNIFLGLRHVRQLETTSAFLSPTNTITAEPSLTTTHFPPLDATPTAGAYATSTIITPTPTALAYPYKLQSGSPVTTTNFIDANAGCKWAGVAGQVFSTDGQPVSGLVVKVEGMLNNRHILTISKTGTANLVGPGGYAAILGNEAITTPGEMQAQLLDKDGNILSAPTAFQIPPGCSGNLVLLNYISIFAPVPTPLPTPRAVFFPLLKSGR